MDLTTEQGRQRAEAAINELYLLKLRWLLPELHPQTKAVVHNHSIRVFIDGLRSSDVDIYLPSTITGGDAQINFANSGAFSPKDEGPFWRTKHACLMLDNWFKVVTLSEAFAAERRKLEQKIKKENNL